MKKKFIKPAELLGWIDPDMARTAHDGSAHYNPLDGYNQTGPGQLNYMLHTTPKTTTLTVILIMIARHHVRAIPHYSVEEISTRSNF